MLMASHKNEAPVVLAELSGEAAPRRPLRVFLWAAIPLLVLFAATRARTVTGEDCGELVSAAYTLGIAHPPGSPIWVMLTKGFQTIFAGINPADAAALGSSITTAVALGLLAVLAFRVTRSRVAALFAAWTTGVGHEIWNHGTIAEVYPLNLLVLAGALILFERWREAPSTRRFFWLTLVYGVGLANHPTFHLFLPVFGLAAIWVRPRIFRDWRTLAAGFLGLLIPHLAYLQVWWAAWHNPFVTWGVEPTFRSILGHYLREVYTSGPAKTPWTFAKAAAQAAVFGRYLLTELSVPGCVAGFLGLILLVRRERIFGALVLTLAFLGTFGLLPFIPFDIEREDLFVVRVFLMPGYLLIGIGLAVAAARLIDLAARWKLKRAAALVLAVPAVAAVLGYRDHDRSNYFWVDDFAHALLDKLPKDTVLFPGGDTSTFPLIYLHCCENARKDVLIADRSGTLERKEVLALLPADLRTKLADAPREVVAEALILQAHRPVVTLRPESTRRGEAQFEPFQLGFIGLPRSEKPQADRLRPAQEAYFNELGFRNDKDRTVQDYTVDIIQSHVAQARAGYLFREGHPPEAIAEAARSAAAAAGIKESLNNVAAMLAEHGHEDLAEPYLREAISIRPDYAIGRRNLVSILKSLHKPAEALAVAAEGLALDPHDRGLLEEGGEAAMECGDGEALASLCARFSEASPKDPLPHRLLGRWARDHEHSDILARAHFEQAVALDPGDTESQNALREIDGRLGIPDMLAMTPDKRDTLADLASLPKPSLGRRLVTDQTADGRRFRPRDQAQAGQVPGLDHMDDILQQARGVPSFDPLLKLPHAAPAMPKSQSEQPTGTGPEGGAGVSLPTKDG